MEYQHSAGIVVFGQEDGQRKYLLLHYVSGHWDFPKGKLEEGETKEQAARRELQEETGIEEVDIIPGFQDSLAYMFTGRSGKKIHKTVTFFAGQTRIKDIILSREHKGFAWLPFEKAVAQVTYKNAKELLEKVELFLNT